MKHIYSLFLAAFFVLPTFSMSDAMRIKITAPNNYKDETIVRFLAGATENYDSQYDAWKLFSNYSQVPSLWTELKNGNPISINAQPELNRDYTIDLHTWINNAGNHTIQIEEVGLFANNVSIYLYDKTTTQLWEIQDGDSINLYFDTSIDSIARLQLIFSLPMEVNQTKEACNDLGSELVLSDIGCSDFSYEIQDSQNNIVAKGNNITNADTLYDLPVGSYNLYIDYPYNLTEISSFNVMGTEVTAIIHTNTTSINLSEGGEIDFTNNSTGANQYNWHFGDGNTSTEIEPIHTYSIGGNYTVTLYSTNNACTAVDEINIEVINDNQTTQVKEDVKKSDLLLIQSNNGSYLQNNTNAIISLKIYSLSGEEVYSIRSSAAIVKIPNEVKSGIYLYQAIYDDKVITGKFYN